MVGSGNLPDGAEIINNQLYIPYELRGQGGVSATNSFMIPGPLGNSPAITFNPSDLSRNNQDKLFTMMEEAQTYNMWVGAGSAIANTAVGTVGMFLQYKAQMKAFELQDL